MKARRPSRRHGLQRPLSSPQIVVLILYPLITACFFALAAEGMLPAEQAPAVLGVHAVAVALAVASWAACTLLDPREEGSCFCPCMALTQREYRPKYCPDCRKVVPGLDHHCVWLNTCIGTRTYGAFYTLAAAGTAQFAVQTVSGVLMLTKWSDTLPKWGSGGAMREPALAIQAMANFALGTPLSQRCCSARSARCWHSTRTWWCEAQWHEGRASARTIGCFCVRAPGPACLRTTARSATPVGNSRRSPRRQQRQ